MAVRAAAVCSTRVGPMSDFLGMQRAVLRSTRPTTEKIVLGGERPLAAAWAGQPLRNTYKFAAGWAQPTTSSTGRRTAVGDGGYRGPPDARRPPP